jgi:hypothetical protein
MKYIGDPQSGSRSSTTASRNRYGQYYRNRSIPVNPNTSPQSANRVLFGAAASAWRGLTAGQRDAWNGYAATIPHVDPLGQTIYWSGFQSFVECYMIKLGIGQTAPTSPPAEFTFVPITITPTLDSGAQTLSIAFTPDPVPAAQVLQFDGTDDYSAGVNFAGPSEYRRLATVAAATVSPQVLTSEYLAVWGTIGPIGNAAFFRARLVSLTGCAGPWVTARTILIA